MPPRARKVRVPVIPRPTKPKPPPREPGEPAKKNGVKLAPGRPVVVLRGGELDGRFYYQDDAEQMVRLADWAMSIPNSTSGPFEWVPTDEFEPHPTEGVGCRVWRRDPALVRQRIEILRRSAHG